MLTYALLLWLKYNNRVKISKLFSQITQIQT